MVQLTSKFTAHVIFLCVFFDFVWGTSQISHVTHELRNWILHTSFDHVQENLMWIITRSETQATKSSLNSTWHIND